jgi:hypothetical protein
MKKLFLIFTLLIATTIISETKSQGLTITYSTFYDALSPYGQWIDYAPYGNVWMSNQAGFRPYYDHGYWAYTNLGWTWVSDYDWGWATFHYGRWVYSPQYGWLWIPGYEWAPSWVSWSRYDNYYGWAPLGPSYGLYSWNSIPASYWVFVPQQYFCNQNVQNYYVSHTQNTTILQQATPIQNVSATGGVKFQSGPALSEVQQVSNVKVQPLSLSPVSAPQKTVVQGNTLKVYKPEVKATKEIVSIPDQQVIPNDKPVIKKQQALPIQEQTQPLQQKKERIKPVQKEERIQPIQKQERTQPVQKQEPVQRAERSQPVQRQQNTQPVQRQERTQPVQRQEHIQQPIQRQERTQPVQRVERIQPMQRVEQTQPIQRQERIQAPVQQNNPPVRGNKRPA